ncbi:MAG: hypothetical protein QOF55_2633 [Thermoleophilaceae bacterium]|nr:hypothetical protein [Thermoleophilaceae bacterium]
MSAADSQKPQVDVPVGQPPSYQLELEDIAVGEGAEARSGDIVEVHYVGVSWKSGEQFDASWDRGSTFKFGLGKGQVIPGWDQGVAGLRRGPHRRSLTTGISPPRANGSANSIPSPLQKRPGSYQLAGRFAGSSPMCW